MRKLKFNGIIKLRRHTADIIMSIPKIGEFYLDSAEFTKCVPTENILKAVNYPKRKRFQAELREHENGLLVFKYIDKEMTSVVYISQDSIKPGFYFNDQCIERFYYENSDDQKLVKNLISSGVLHSEVVSYNLYINGTVINSFHYELSDHPNKVRS